MNIFVLAASYPPSPPLTLLPTPKVSLMRLNKGLEAGVLLAQGALAGLTLASMYTMALADSLVSFVAAYEVRTGFPHPPACASFVNPNQGPVGPLACETALKARNHEQCRNMKDHIFDTLDQAGLGYPVGFNTMW